MASKIIINKEYLENIQTYGDTIAKNLAIIFREKLTDRYKKSVNSFYSSYTPMFYKREYQLQKTCSPFYTKNNSGHSFHGGVIIYPDKMKYKNPEIHDTPEYILNNSLEGIHGIKTIYTPRWILTDVLIYREYLFHRLSGNDSISREAINRSRI